MPGINLIFQHTPLDNSLPKEVDRILATMKYMPQYESEIKLIGHNLILGVVTYPGYPLEYSRRGSTHIIIEGFIYGEGRRKIDGLIKSISEDPSGKTWNDKSSLKELLLNTDGEFLIIVANEKTGQICIFNDALGRITFYYYQNKDRFILSREPKFIIGTQPGLTLSPMAIAEALLFLYPLGTGTMFNKIQKLAPAAMISIRAADKKIAASHILKWNFSEDQIEMDPGKYADELIEPFLQSSIDRIETFRDRINILTLSGGLDSRTVLAGLKKFDINLNLITFVDQRGDLFRDLAVARELAGAYGMETQRIDLPGINIDDMNRLVNMKDGHGTGGIMGTVMKSLDILLEKFGHGCAFYTGDGGGLILAPRCQNLRLNNLDDLTMQILRRNTFFTIDEVASIIRMDPDDLKAHIQEHFALYPETSLRDKYGHFSIFEHLFRQSFEGEDRVKFFFWGNTTFYSMPYFYKAMLLSDESKENHRLFAHFHKKLDPRIAKIKYANWGFPVSSPLTPAYLFLKNWTIDRPRVEKIVRRAIYTKRFFARHGRIETVDPETLLLKENIRNVIAMNPEIDKYIDTKRIIELLPGWKNHLQLYSITNIVTYIGNLLRSGCAPGIGD